MVLDNKFISGWYLLCQYVKLTSFLPPSSPVLRALVSPNQLLSSDRIASITKTLLGGFVIPMYMWGAHCKRGAAVQFYKNLGLSSEQVCEIGQWKNMQAFKQHYLRIGSHEVGSSSVQAFVHNVSHCTAAEPERSHTPPREPEGGGSDLEGEARMPCEPTLSLPKSEKTRRQKRPRSPPDIPQRFEFKTPRSSPLAVPSSTKDAKGTAKKMHTPPA